MVAAATLRPDHVPRDEPHGPLPTDASLVAVPGAVQGAQGLPSSDASARGACTGTGARLLVVAAGPSGESGAACAPGDCHGPDGPASPPSLAQTP